MSALKEEIEFWQSSCEDDYEEVLKDLIDHGYTEDEAVALLSKLYHTTAGEFGG